MVATDARTPLVIRLPPGNTHDGHYGQHLITELADIPAKHLTMDRAYEGDETCALVRAKTLVRKGVGKGVTYVRQRSPSEHG